MIALQLLETKDFMNKLLLSTIFDHFCLVQASISTFQTVTLDGKRNQAYYSSEELEQLPPYATWEEVRTFCLELMKGQRTPLSFLITLSLSPSNIANVLRSIEMDIDPEHVKGMFLNLKFDGEKILCTTGTSLSIFTLDKRIEQEWDSLTEKFMKKHHICFERM